MLYVETDIVLGRVILKTITKEMIDTYHSATIEQIVKDGDQDGPELEQHFPYGEIGIAGVGSSDNQKYRRNPCALLRFAIEEAESALAILRLLFTCQS